MEAINGAIAMFNASVGIIVVLLLATHQRMVKFPASHKLGLWVGGIGMAYQAADWILLGENFHRSLLIIPSLSWTMILLAMAFSRKSQRFGL